MARALRSFWLRAAEAIDRLVVFPIKEYFPSKMVGFLSKLNPPKESADGKD